MMTVVEANNPKKVIKDKKTVTSVAVFYCGRMSYVSQQGLFMRNHQTSRFPVVCFDEVDAIRILGS